MGCKSSKKKFNKKGEKQKIFKVGLSFGRNDLKIEGNFQTGYHSKIDKKYVAVDGICEPRLPETREFLSILPEEEEGENGRVPSTSLLQS